jgi:hypothetical protein
MNHVVLIGRSAAVLGAAAFVLHATPALAHGFAGRRFFPATITNDDPFVADELSLPTADWFKNGERPAEGETDVSVEFSKRILDNFGISFERTWTHLDRRNEQNKSGFQNLETTLKYQFFTDAEHEAIVSAGLGVEWGDTGARQVGAESFTVLTPAIFFGKGAGDLPEDLNWLRPFAITGLVGYAVPTDEQHTRRSINEDTGELERETEKHSQTVVYGFSLEYSLPYLQANVRDVGLPSFVNRLIPLVEFSFETPVQHRQGEDTTAFVNPGVLWVGHSFQVGAEAVIPLNRDSGTGVGVIGQLHFYLDDLFPTTIGKPIF